MATGDFWKGALLLAGIVITVPILIGVIAGFIFNGWIGLGVTALGYVGEYLIWKKFVQ